MDRLDRGDIQGNILQGSGGRGSRAGTEPPHFVTTRGGQYCFTPRLGAPARAGLGAP